MPAIDSSFLNNELEANVKDYPSFVETGTYKGESIFNMEPYFDKLYTIEIKKEFYEEVRSKYTGDKITFLLGDSSSLIGTVCSSLTENTIFFLDGHWSSCGTGKGDKDCPLYEELQSIMIELKQKAIVIIDDVRLFGKGPNKGNEVCNWEDISSSRILEIVGPRLDKCYYRSSELCTRDRMILHLSEK
jgi:hypothetical protein